MKRDKDLRVVRTRKAIKESFIKLLYEKDFDEISIKDIAEEAMINRSTFYLHYNDKYELMKSLSEEIVNDLVEIAEIICKESNEKSMVYGTKPHIIAILSYVEKNPKLFGLVSSATEIEKFYDNIADKFIEDLSDRLILIKEFDQLFEYKRKIVIAICATVINKWIKDDMNIPKSDLADFIYNAISGAIYEK